MTLEQYLVLYNNPFEPLKSSISEGLGLSKGCLLQHFLQLLWYPLFFVYFYNRHLFSNFLSTQKLFDLLTILNWGSQWNQEPCLFTKHLKTMDYSQSTCNTSAHNHSLVSARSVEWKTLPSGSDFALGQSTCILLIFLGA